METKFPYLLSPTGYFRDGSRQICLDFLAIPMYNDKYKIVLGKGGMAVKLSMKIPQRFTGYERLLDKLNQANVVKHCNTIMSAQ
jgi:hypothetical protein